MATNDPGDESKVLDHKGAQLSSKEKKRAAYTDSAQSKSKELRTVNRNLKKVSFVMFFVQNGAIANASWSNLLVKQMFAVNRQKDCVNAEKQ